MARRVVFLLVFFVVFVLASCLDKTRAAGGVQVRDEDIRYSKEFYYELLLYIKEHHLMDLDDCPHWQCFDEHTCVDLCDAGLWP
ncbi:hypothetical protein Zmor_008338 [Zophobas morio]|uniref:Uncharacterized protein n=1 Tax=Zophobas morio TaxID=2755281 RepID=A0AA38MQ67_9CUCU|nr:hypothetical protein Zmor_008338 [Zophobas morio]